MIQRLDKTTPQVFYEQLCSAFIVEILNSQALTERYFEALFYSGSKEPGNVVSLLLEIADWSSRFEYPVGHPKVRDWINLRLLSTSTTTEITSEIYPDIFGNDDTGWEQTFDDVRMKNALGNVKLRAMSSAAACQYRYGKADSESCSVGQMSRKKTKSALEWLTDPDRKDKTWTAISRAADNKEILLAYPSELPAELPQAAMMFGGTVDTDTDNTARFEDCAENVTGTLRGIMASNPSLNIRVFLLRKMDTARTRVSNNKHCSAEHFIEAAEQWQKGCRNRPNIHIKQFNKENRAEWREAETPYPMQVIWTLNTLWSRNGDSSSRVKTVTAEDGIFLLLDNRDTLRSVLDRLLYAATKNLSGLALALGQAHAQGQVAMIQKNYIKQALIMPSILGLLLYKKDKINLNKEQYMKSPPYIIGRLLSLADQLHYLYCKHVRNGSVPPQLMGNALMPTALEQPVKALALYSHRILPYQAWARTFRGDEEESKRVHGALKILGETCAEDGLQNLPERCTDADKAQMLIGYLARSEKTESGNTKKGE